MEERKRFSDSSLPWIPRALDNSRWVGLNNWTNPSGDSKWHQLKEDYSTPLDLLWTEDESFPSVKSVPYKVKPDQAEEVKEKDQTHVVQDLFKAGEAARIVRHYIQN